MITLKPYEQWTKEEVLSYMGVWKYNNARELREIIDRMRSSEPSGHRFSLCNVYKALTTRSQYFSDFLSNLTYQLKNALILARNRAKLRFLYLKDILSTRNKVRSKVAKNSK